MNAFPVPVEANSLAAIAVFSGAVVIDALTAHDPAVSIEAPTAMRTSAVVLIACFAAPPIRQYMVYEQRFLVALFLALVAFTGWHEAAHGTRLADVVFVGVMTAMSTFAFWWPSTKNSKHAPPYTRRESLNSLAIATLFYASLRILRSGIAHPQAVRAYKVAAVTYDSSLSTSMGYAHASTTTTAALCFGGAAGIATSIALFSNDALRVQGTSAATIVLTTAALVQLTAAFIVTLAGSSQLVHLPALFSTGACGSASVCPEAWRARRFAVVNSAAAGLWLNGFGCLILAYAPSARVRTRAQMTAYKQEPQSAELTLYAALTNLVALSTVFNLLSFSGSESLTDYAVTGAVASCFVTAFVDRLLGVTIFVVSIVADLYLLVYNHGFGGVFSYYTHTSNAITMALLCVYIIVTFVVDLTWHVLSPSVVELADRVSGAAVLAATSLAVALFLGTSVLHASYDGMLLTDASYRAGDSRYQRWAAAMAIEHWVGPLVLAPLNACRCETAQLSPKMRAVAWYGAVAFAASLWLIVRGNVDDASLSNVQDGYGATPFLIGSVPVVLVPWAVLVWS